MVKLFFLLILFLVNMGQMARLRAGNNVRLPLMQRCLCLAGEDFCNEDTSKTIPPNNKNATKMKKYVLIINASIFNKGVFQSKHEVDLVINVKPQPRQSGEKEVESPSTTAYKITFSEMCIALNKSYEKLRDFVRRTIYRYENICPLLNADGKPVGITNEDSLMAQWQEIREALQADYNGPFVDEELPFLDTSMAWAYPMGDYCFFALLFPGIAKNVPLEWQTERKVWLCYPHGDVFNERITCKDVDPEERIYTVEGELNEPKKGTSGSLEGYMKMKNDSFSPYFAFVKVIYRKGNESYECTFKLRQATAYEGE